MAVGVEKKFEKNGAFERLNVIELDCDGFVLHYTKSYSICTSIVNTMLTTCDLYC